MTFRRFYLVFIVVAGLCSFNTATQATLPQVARTELVVSVEEQAQLFFSEPVVSQKPGLVFNDGTPLLIPPSFHHYYHHSLLIQSQQHHASL